MFIVTQLIGLFVIQAYTSNDLPYSMQPPKEVQAPKACILQDSKLDYASCLVKSFPGTLLISFIIAIGLFLILTKLKAESFIRAWFFLVTILALAITLNALFFNFNIIYPSIFAFVISAVLAFFKIYKRNMILHNLTELLIYPGIAVVLIPILGVMGIVLLLLLISLYDIWAVWKSQFMQKLAKYQMDNLKIFTGFFIPYADKKQREKIQLIKDKYKNKSKEFVQKQFEKSKIKVNLAILGGGDIVFPIITAGVFYRAYESLIPAFLIVISATLGLTYLFISAKKGKFYPAMPFLTIAMYIGMIISWIIMSFLR